MPKEEKLRVTTSTTNNNTGNHVACQLEFAIFHNRVLNIRQEKNGILGLKYLMDI